MLSSILGCCRILRVKKCLGLIILILILQFVLYIVLLVNVFKQTNLEKDKETDNADPIAFEGAFESVPCGDSTECYRFRQLMTSWPESKPKAAIYFLTRPNVRTGQVKDMMTSLFKHFNNKFRYPIIVFHTGDMSNETDIILSAVQLRDLVFMQEIEFEIPRFFPKRENTKCPGAIGYRHMCRFHSNTVYLHPIMQGLEYAWRLDDDSQLMEPSISYDVFAFMKQHHLIYGYRHISIDWASCVQGLWDGVYQYKKQNGIKGQFIDKWKNGKMFYNNFEISQVSFWTSPEYRRFITYIDRLGGIYSYRWGDAPIKSLALALFVPANQIHRFSDIGYKHQKLEQFGRVITPKPRFLYVDLPKH